MVRKKTKDEELKNENNDEDIKKVDKLSLRPYQKRILYKVLKKLANNTKSAFVQSSPGSGKTLIMADLAEKVSNNGGYVLSLAHRQEIIKQTLERYAAQGADMSHIQVMMVQTAFRHLDDIHIPDLIITDEAHHAMADTYLKVYNHFAKLNTKEVFFSATPWRADGKGFTKLVNEKDLILGPSTKKLIEDHYLSDYDYYQPKIIDDMTLKFSKKGGDFTKKSVEKAAKEIDPEQVVQWYQKLGNNEQGLVYAPTIELSEKITDAFNNAGITAFHLDGASDKKEREKIIQDYRDGKVQILSNVEIFTEGLDLPNASVALLVRPTMSLSLYLQFAMRVLRYKEGKRAKIIDFVGNASKLGLPDDDFAWSLRSHEVFDPNNKKAYVCEKCKKVFSKNEILITYKHDEINHTAKITETCPNCGFIINEFESEDVQNQKAFEEEANKVIEESYDDEEIYDDNVDMTTLSDREKFRRFWLANIDFDSSHSLAFNFTVLYEKMQIGMIPQQTEEALVRLLFNAFYDNALGTVFADREFQDLANKVHDKTLTVKKLNKISKEEHDRTSNSMLARTPIDFNNSVKTNMLIAQAKHQIIKSIPYYKILFDTLSEKSGHDFNSISEDDLPSEIKNDINAYQYFLKKRKEVADSQLYQHQYTLEDAQIVKFKTGTQGIQLNFRSKANHYGIKKVFLFTGRNDINHLTSISTQLFKKITDSSQTIEQIRNNQLLILLNQIQSEYGKTFLIMNRDGDVNKNDLIIINYDRHSDEQDEKMSI